MTEEELRFRGERATQLLNDPLMIEAFEAVRKEVISKWQDTPARDSDAREWLWKLHQASLRFEMIFKGFMDSGRIADDAIKHRQSLTDRLKSVIR